jgi:hypothetical protein
MATMNQIEKLTKEYAEARRKLSDMVNACEKELSEVKRLHIPRIKRAVEAAAEKQSALYAAVEQKPDFFEKPRSVIFYGIRVGYQKGKGELQWEDTEQVIKLIKKHFPEQADILIKTKEEPARNALAKLSVHDLKRIGVTVIETGDQVLIKSTDSEIDKLVNALLKDEIEEAKEAE